MVETEAFEERALELAATLADGPPVAHRYTKRATWAGRESVEAGLELESVAFGQLMATDDVTEGGVAVRERPGAPVRGEVATARASDRAVTESLNESRGQVVL